MTRRGPPPPRVERRDRSNAAPIRTTPSGERLPTVSPRRRGDGRTVDADARGVTSRRVDTPVPASRSGSTSLGTFTRGRGREPSRASGRFVRARRCMRGEFSAASAGTATRSGTETRAGTRSRGHGTGVSASAFVSGGSRPPPQPLSSPEGWRRCRRAAMLSRRRRSPRPPAARASGAVFTRASGAGGARGSEATRVGGASPASYSRRRHERRLAAGSRDVNDVGVGGAIGFASPPPGDSRVTRRAGERVDAASEIDAFRASSRYPKARVLLGHARAFARASFASTKSRRNRRSSIAGCLCFASRSARGTPERQYPANARSSVASRKYSGGTGGASPAPAPTAMVRRRNARVIFLHSASYSEKHAPPSRSRSTSSKSVATRSEASSRSKRAGDAPRSAVTTSSGERRPSVAIRRRERRLARIRRRAFQRRSRGRSGRHRAVHRLAAAAAAAHGDADATSPMPPASLSPFTLRSRSTPLSRREPRGNSADFAVFGATERRRAEDAANARSGETTGAPFAACAAAAAATASNVLPVSVARRAMAATKLPKESRRARSRRHGRRRRRRRRMSDGERARRGRRRTDGRTARGTCGWRSSADGGRLKVVARERVEILEGHGMPAGVGGEAGAARRAVEERAAEHRDEIVVRRRDVAVADVQVGGEVGAVQAVDDAGVWGGEGDGRRGGLRRWVGKKRGTGAVPSWRTRGERCGRWSSRLGAPASANTIFERVDLPSASARARYASCASGGAGDVGALSRDDVSSETGKHDGTSRRHARARSRGVQARRRTLSGSRTACMLVMLVRTLSGSAIASAVGASASRVPRCVEGQPESSCRQPFRVVGEQNHEETPMAPICFENYRWRSRPSGHTHTRHRGMRSSLDQNQIHRLVRLTAGPRHHDVATAGSSRVRSLFPLGGDRRACWLDRPQSPALVTRAATAAHVRLSRERFDRRECDPSASARPPSRASRPRGF